MFVSIVYFLIILSVIVLIHEAGHFIAARRNGVLVEEFGFGLPPRLFGKKIGETIYSVNLLPFGGFVRLHGELSERGITEPKRAFLTKKAGVRARIILAGVFMNALLSVLAFSIVYSFSGIPRETDQVKILEVLDASPAQEAGLVAGDIVLDVAGKKVNTVTEFISVIEENKGDRVALQVSRDGETKALAVRPRETPPEGEGPLGVYVTATEIFFPALWARPFIGVYYGFKEALFWGWQVVFALLAMVKGLFSGIIPQDLAGPVGIFAITSQAAAIGILAVINFVGILSVNLAILNVLPFPALDGGRLLFIFLEKFFGKKVLPRVESIVHMAGMVILLALLLAITVYDVKRLITNGGISGYLDSIAR